MIQNIETYRPKKGERILVDANVLLFVFCPIGNYKLWKIRKYEQFLNNAKNAGSELLITSLILSEFVNRWLRFEFGEFRKNHPSVSEGDFKSKYRSSQDCVDSLYDIENTVTRQVLNYVTPVNDAFDNLQLSAYFRQDIDFNDGHTVALARNQGYSILTDDGDFGAVGSVVNVITWNRGLLGV